MAYPNWAIKTYSEARKVQGFAFFVAAVCTIVMYGLTTYYG